MAVRVKIDFYQLKMPDGFDQSFDVLSEKVSKLVGRNRNCEVHGAVIRLHKMLFEKKLVEGDLIRLRMDALPVKGDLDGKLEEIDFGDEEGIAEQTAFLFDPASSIVLLQRNRTGVGASTFLHYFQQKGKVPDCIELLPVIKAEAMRRLAKFQEIRKLQVVLAKPAGSAKLAHADTASLGSFLDAMETLQAPRAEFEFSVGRKKSDGLLLQNAKELVRNIFAAFRSSSDVFVEKLVVTGKNEAGERDILDILRDRVVFEIDLESDRGRRLKYGVRRDALLKAWEQRQDEVSLYAK